MTGRADSCIVPCLPSIASDLSVSIELINLTVTSYMIFQGLTPTLWGAIADVKGRRLVYIFTFLIYFAACVGLAETRNYATLVVLRCLQSTGSASTIAIGSGVVGDITTRSERGSFMGIFQAGLLVPVAIGPVIGGALANSLGWRSIFWFLAIYSGIFVSALLLCFPETLRALVGNGSVHQQGFLRYPLSYFQKRYHARSNIPPQTELAPPRSINIFLPLLVLIDASIIPVISCLAFHYAVWQMSITVLSTLMQSIYGLSDIQTGLTFIGNGVGSMIGAVLTGRLLDLDFARAVKKGKGEAPPPRARLRSVWLWSMMEIAAVLVFGWTLDRQVHLSVPIVATFFIGWSAMAIQSTISTYLVDEFPEKSASASAALNLARCLLGAAGTAAVLPILKGIGTGWCFTLLAGIMACSLVIMLLCITVKTKNQRPMPQS